MTTVTATKQKINIELSESIKKVIKFTAQFAGTKEKTLKEMFEDMLIIIKPKEIEFASSNQKALTRVKLKGNFMEEDQEEIYARVKAEKMASIIDKIGNEDIQIEINNDNIQVKGKSTKIKLQQKDGKELREAFENMFEKNLERIATLPVKDLIDLLEPINTYTQKTDGKMFPIKLTISENEIVAYTTEGNSAILNKITAPTEKETEISIYPEIIPEIMKLLKAINNKETKAEIFSTENSLKIQISTIELIIHQANQQTPDVENLILSLQDATKKETIIETEKIKSSLELAKDLLEGKYPTATLKGKDNTLILETKEATTEFKKEIEAILEEEIKTDFAIKLFLNALEEVKSEKILLQVINKIHLIKNPEKEYPVALFAGVATEEETETKTEEAG